MPVVEFALDDSAQQRIRIYLPARQPASITVKLNRSVLGSLTPDEQLLGKDFCLPDNSFLNVRMIDGQPQVTHAGYPLPLVGAAKLSVEDPSPAALAQKRSRKRGVYLMAWLIMNMLGVGILIAIDIAWVFHALSLGVSPFRFILLSLSGFVGLVGVGLLFFWKKLGFYLAAAYVALNFLLAISSHLIDAYSVISIVDIALLYLYEKRSGTWEKMS